ncbi:MAG: hypothetical protein ACYDDQ_02040 [Vulcanimicrobiaceae bacterium]
MSREPHLSAHVLARLAATLLMVLRVWATLTRVVYPTVRRILQDDNAITESRPLVRGYVKQSALRRMKHRLLGTIASVEKPSLIIELAMIRRLKREAALRVPKVHLKT